MWIKTELAPIEELVNPARHLFYLPYGIFNLNFFCFKVQEKFEKKVVLMNILKM